MVGMDGWVKVLVLTMAFVVSGDHKGWIEGVVQKQAKGVDRRSKERVHTSDTRVDEGEVEVSARSAVCRSRVGGIVDVVLCRSQGGG